MVDDDDLVGKEEHDVALPIGTGEALRDGVELEGEVITEGAVKPKMRAFAIAEQRDEGSHRGKGGRLADTFLLGEPRLRFADLEGERLFASRETGEPILRRHRLADARQQDGTALVEGRDLDLAPPRREAQGRVGEAHIPPRVAAGIFVIRGEHRAASRVERLAAGENGQGPVTGVLGRAPHLHAALRGEGDFA